MSFQCAAHRFLFFFFFIFNFVSQFLLVLFDIFERKRKFFTKKSIDAFIRNSFFSPFRRICMCQMMCPFSHFPFTSGVCFDYRLSATMRVCVYAFIVLVRACRCQKHVDGIQWQRGITNMCETFHYYFIFFPLVYFQLECCDY